MKAGARLIIIGLTVLALAAAGIWLVLSGLSVVPTANIISSPQSLEGPVLATKIIDGDTFVMEGGESVRLLGMDTDERGYPCYSAASRRLETLILNKEIYLERDAEDRDQYGRLLRYVFLDGTNINLLLVKEGLAVARFYPENVMHKEEIVQAEKTAMENRVGCKWANTSVKQEVQTNLPAGVIDACKAGEYTGKEKTVQGKVAQSSRSKSGTVFLNFGAAYPNHCFTAVIFSSDQAAFPDKPEDYYKGKTLRIKGTIEDYEGKPEIILENKEQVDVV